MVTIFITAYYVTNHETEIFSMALSGEGMCWGSIATRLLLGCMFTWAAVNHEGGQFRKALGTNILYRGIFKFIIANPIILIRHKCPILL